MPHQGLVRAAQRGELSADGLDNAGVRGLGVPQSAEQEFQVGAVRAEQLLAARVQRREVEHQRQVVRQFAV